MKQRIITAAIGIPIVLGALLAPTPWVWGVLVTVATILCLREYGELTNTNGGIMMPVTLVSLVLIAYSRAGAENRATMLALLLLIGMAGSALVPVLDKRTGGPRRSSDPTPDGIGEGVASGRAADLAPNMGALMGVFILFASGLALILGQAIKLGSINAALLAMVPIWAGDTAAIFAGKAFGKHKLAPTISPNKTWEGSIANLLACIAATFALGLPNHVSPLACALVGLSTGILGQLGDLYESLLKRRAGVKDSGTLLPGHGGIYDRIDSLMMSAAPSILILMSLR